MGRDARESVDQLEGLLRVAQIARRAPLAEALPEIAATLGESLGYGTVTIGLVRPAFDDFEVVALHGDATTRERLLGRTTARGTWDALVALHRVGSGAALSVGMRDVRGELLGVLTVDDPSSGRMPTDVELDVLVAAAGHLAGAVEASQAVQAAHRLREGTELLLAVSADLHAGRSTDEVLAAVCDGISRALGFERVLAMLTEPDGFIRPRAGVGFGFADDAASLTVSIPLAAMEHLAAAELQREGCLLFDGVTAERIVGPEVPRTFTSTRNGAGPRGWRRHWLLVPLTSADGRLRGMIWADDPVDHRVPSRSTLQALRLFADQASGALGAAERLERMRELAERDPLTGLPNRRALESFLERCEGAEPVSLLVCDLDHFKHVNDQLGHDVGDETLIRFARILSRLARREDLAVRLGGEEFALVLPRTETATAFEVAERLLAQTRRAFADLPRGLTVSVGIAAADSAEALRGEGLRQADRALYVAKRSGRDRAVVHHLDTIGDLLTNLGASKGHEDQLGAVLMLAETLDLRDDATARHSRTVGRYAELIAQRLGMPEHRIERLRIAGVLHDVGKVGVADAVLRKPGPLDAAEWREMRRHSELGAKILSNAGLPDVAIWVLAHHERVDGCGYPAEMPGAEIPLEARVLAVADAYEAMTADRPYRRALSVEVAEAELERCAGSQFDPVVVRAFRAALRELSPLAG